MFSWLNKSKKDPSLQRLEDRNARYGVHPVPAARVYAITAGLVQAAELQFTEVKEGRWARTVDPDIIQLLSLQAGKGAAYVFRWGLSLSFVPHEWSPQPKFHRTLKAARPDLFETAGEFLVKDPFSGEDEKFTADTLHGEECFREDLQRAWSGLRPYLANWFSSTTTLAGVLAVAKTHAEKDWQSFRHSPDPKMVYAFTLARSGRMEEGRRALKELAAANPETYGAPELESALAGIAAIRET
jgi:hypothetical protein